MRQKDFAWSWLIVVLLIPMITFPVWAQWDTGGGADIIEATDCSGYITEGTQCWDTDNNLLFVGDGATATQVGPGSSSATAGTYIDIVGDAISVDLTEVSDATIGAGEADHVWTFDTTGTDPVMTTSSGTFAFTGAVTAKQLQSGAIVGSELTTNGTFTTDLTGWSGADWSSSSNTALHAADTGHTAALTQNITVSTGETYQISFTMAGRTAGSVAVTVGAVPVYLAGTLTAFDSNNTFRRSFVAADTGAVALSFTPTETFDGSIDTVTVKVVTLDSNGVGFNLLDSAGNSNLMLRATLESENNTFLGRSAGLSNSNGVDNTFVGRAAGYRNISGHSNAMVGKHAGFNNSSGYSNTLVGQNAGYSNTSGANNTLLGQGAGFAITTALYDTVVGQSAGLALTTGDGNTLIGQAAGQSLTTAGYNTALGWGSGRFLNDGSTALETPTYSTYIGYRARGAADDETNAVVIGGNTALGKGSNTTVIGNASTTDVYLYGDHAVKQTFDAGSAHLNGTAAGFAEFYEPSGGGSSYVKVQAPALAGNVTLTLPVDDGTDGQVLKTDGSGVLAWIDATSSGAATEGTLTDVAGTAVSVDYTEAEDATWGDGSVTGGSLIWTFNIDGGTDPVITISDGVVNVSAGALQVAGAAVGAPTAGTLTDVSGTAVSVDTTESDDLTWGAAAGGSQTWTFDTGAATDPAIAFSDGLVTISAGTFRVGTADYAAPGTSGNIMKSDGTDWTSSDSLAVATFNMTSGTSSIPWVVGTTTGANTTEATAYWESDTDLLTIGDGAAAQQMYGAKTDSITSAQLLGSLSNETGTGVAVFGTSPTFTTGVTMADSATFTFDESAANPDDADVRLSATDGKLTIVSVNGANNEDISIDTDATANTIEITSSTGATAVDFNTLNLVTTGTIQAGVTISSDADGMDAAAMTTPGLYGTMFIATGAGTWILPRAALGMSLCLMDSGTAHDLILDVTAGSTIRLAGAEGGDGVGITNASGSSTGDFICVIAVATDKWSTVGKSGTWASQ